MSVTNIGVDQAVGFSDWRSSIRQAGQDFNQLIQSLLNGDSTAAQQAYNDFQRIQAARASSSGAQATAASAATTTLEVLRQMLLSNHVITDAGADSTTPRGIPAVQDTVAPQAEHPVTAGPQQLFGQAATPETTGAWLFATGEGLPGNDPQNTITSRREEYQNYLVNDLGYTQTEALMATPNANGITNYTLLNVMNGQGLNTGLDDYGVLARPALDSDYYIDADRRCGGPGTFPRPPDPTQTQLAARQSLYGSGLTLPSTIDLLG